MTARNEREVAANPYQIRVVPPPLPLPVLPEPYGMRFARPHADAEMITEWMNRPHLAGLWSRDNSVTWWREHLSNQLAGWYSRPYVVSLAGQDIGYVELFRVAQDVVGTVYEADPYDVGVHGAIADPANIRKGIGELVFRHIVATMFSAEPQCRRIIGDSELNDDAPGRRFDQRMGAVFIGEPYVAQWGYRIALSVWPRSPEDIPRLREPPPGVSEMASPDTTA